MKLFDSHIHIFEKPYGEVFNNSHIKNGREGEFSLFNEYRKRYNVIGVFVIAYEDKKWPNNNKFVACLAHENRWLYPFGHITKDRGDFLTQAKKLISIGHFGVSLYLDKDDSASWLSSDNMKDYWEFLKEYSIPMSINMKVSQVKPLLRVAERYPNQVFLLSHMLRPIITNGRFNKRLYEPIFSLKEFENVYIKLSGFYAFVRDGWRYPQKALFEVLDILKKTFGAKRLIWGSDFSPVLEFNTYKQSFEVINSEYRGFDRGEMNRIFHENSIDIVRRRKGWTRESTPT